MDRVDINEVSGQRTPSYGDKPAAATEVHHPDASDPWALADSDGADARREQTASAEELAADSSAFLNEGEAASVQTASASTAAPVFSPPATSRLALTSPAIASRVEQALKSLEDFTWEIVETSQGPQSVPAWPHPDRVRASLRSLEVARETARRSPRRHAAPIRKLFVRNETEPAPLARLYGSSGGRSTVVALKLYLTIVWRCSAAPFTTHAPARAWAELLDLPDPATAGARRVSSALKTLERHRLIKLERRSGSEPPLITLLEESGDGADYTAPSTSYQRSPKGPGRDRNVYFQIPGRLWTEGKIQALSGPGLVMLLILLAEQGGDGARVWFSTEIFPARYRISHKTRAAGTRQLVEQGLLFVEPEVLAPRPNGSALDIQRRRNVYHLLGPALREKPEEANTSAPPKRRPRRRKPDRSGAASTKAPSS